MLEGYEQVAMMERRVEGSKAVMVTLRPVSENRGVSVAQPQSNTQVVVMDEFGNRQSMDQMQMMAKTNRELSIALQSLGRDVGHLGAAGRHNMPGLTIISGETVGKAHDMGLLAARRGDSAAVCPFPKGSAPHTIWMQGYRGSSRGKPQEVTKAAMNEAYEQGHHVAKSLDAEDEAHCPYPPGSPLHAPWLKGFVDGGGRVV